MPFLLRVPGGPTSALQPVELKSSRALVGTNPSTCDVVMSVNSGALELHALLNIASDQSSATVVPFSSSQEGACFVNGREVPGDGMTAVHGDRVAFGRANTTFIFSLTAAREDTTKQTTSLSNSRSFRRALDSLRGDRAPSASVRSSLQQRTTAEPTKGSQSKERLERFLLDASTDSLLSDYVERKLRASKSSSDRRRPAAMEPPPSLSASTVSSLRSSLADSILDRSSTKREATQDEQSASMALLSTAERNYAEIEKLRLSQRLREVNNVLNGHLEFSSSYLSMPRQSSESLPSMHYSSPAKARNKQSTDERVDAEEEPRDDDTEDGDDELPAMMEKPPVKAALARSTKTTRRQKEEGEEAEFSARDGVVASSLKMLCSTSQSNQDDSLEDTTPDDIALDESLPSFSEANLNKQAGRVGGPGPQSSQNTNPKTKSVTDAAPSRTRTPLHQQLIDRTIQRVRHQILTEGFVRWRRSLRIQDQRRREKALQLQKLYKRLGTVRRNHCFLRWKRLSDCRQQALQCRIDAFDVRRQTRLLRRVWVCWKLSMHTTSRVGRQLVRVLTVYSNARLRAGFTRWRSAAMASQIEGVRQSTQVQEGNLMERRMENVAAQHYRYRIQSRSLANILRVWSTLARQERLKERVLKHILQHIFLRQQLRAWTAWKQHTLMKSYGITLDHRHTDELRAARHEVQQHYEDQTEKTRANYERQIQELESKLKQQDDALRSAKAERERVKKAQAAARMTSKASWDQSVTKLLERSIAEADERIGVVGSHLERLLQMLDADANAARMQAATLLIEMMLEQKVVQANERVREQEDFLSVMATTASVDLWKQPQKGEWQSSLSKNARYLSDLLQQRRARLHQLHQALSKLAASAMDADGHVKAIPSKHRHALFLADTMAKRAVDHTEFLVALLHRRCEMQATNDVKPEARKY